jgi:hypothetical protein
MMTQSAHPEHASARRPSAKGATTILTFLSRAQSSAASSRCTRRAGPYAIDVDAGAPRGPHARGNARGRDGGVRQVLAVREPLAAS